MDHNGASNNDYPHPPKRPKSNPLKPNASSRLVPPLHVQILHHPLPPTRRDSRLPPRPLQHVPPPAHPPARPVYTSSDGAQEAEAWSSCGSAVGLVISASSSLYQSPWRGWLYHHRILSSSQFVDSFSLASLLVSSQYPSHVTPRITGMPFGCGASASVPNSGSIQALPGYKIALACVTKYMEQRSAAVKTESLLYCGR